MFRKKLYRQLVIVSFSLMMAVIPLAGLGCQTAQLSGPATDLAATNVPPVDLDLYIYVNQGVPTRIPASLTGAATDIYVQALSIWGIADGNSYSLSGALTFASAAEADQAYSRVPVQPGIWTKLSGQTIYAVLGSGGQSDIIKTAISSGSLRPYNDQAALAELSLMPAGDSTKAGIIGIIKPNQAAINVFNRYTDPKTAATINTIFTWTRPAIIAFGMFSPLPVDIGDLVQRLANNTIQDMDLGAVAMVKSAFPGFIVTPIAGRVLDDSNLARVVIGGLTVYKDSIKAGAAGSVQALINVSENNVFITASPKESYAETLMTGIKR